MTKYLEILRLHSLEFSGRNIATICGCSRNTVAKVLNRAKELGISWPLQNEAMTDADIEQMMFPKEQANSVRRKPNTDYIHKELKRNGVNLKLLWTEYCEECRMNGETPLMYSQFCYHVQQDQQKRRASMHLNRKPGEQVEVDWAGDPAFITDRDTGELTKAYIFVGVMTYSQYAYVEAFNNEKQKAWITAHVNMYQYFDGVAKILVCDNLKTGVVHNRDWYTPELNVTYSEMARHYGTVIIPARIRKPKDKPNAEGAVGIISTWITAALRNEQFFSLPELNKAIREKLEAYNANPFQKKEGSRLSIFLGEEKPFLSSLPATRFELAEWKIATVQFNYHITVEKMHYSVPYEYIKRKVDVRITDNVIEVFYNQNRICCHRRLYGRPGQYSTIVEHMPEDHQKYLEWDGRRFLEWAERIGKNTYLATKAILSSQRVEQQSYRSCMGLLKLADKYSVERLETACKKALMYSANPSYKSIKNILTAGKDKTAEINTADKPSNSDKFGITRGAGYYGRK